jgi:predicted metal-binding membrane protein
VIASAHEHPTEEAGLAPAFAAARARLGLIALLFVLTALAWWSTVDRMRGMDQGPGTDLGTLSWFLGVWMVMMAAMMLPSVSPTVALYAHMTRARSPVAPLVFTSGYLLTWARGAARV